MSTHTSGTPADVVAVFDTQGAAEEGVYRLRLAGFGESQIACYSRPPGIGLLDTFNPDFAFVGAAAGGAVGIGLGAFLWPLVNQWGMFERNVSDPLGLSSAMCIILALACGLIGWGIGLGVKRPVLADPASVPTSSGAFVLAVNAGADRDRAWTAIRAAGGREPGAAAAHH